MKYFIKTYGCQMNKSDSERLANFLEKKSLVQAKNELSADFIILNSCIVRQSAEDRIYGEIENLKKLKKERKKFFIGVTGCLASKNPEKVEGKADIVFGINDLLTLEQFIDSKKQPFAKNQEDQTLQGLTKAKNYFQIPPKCSSKSHALIPIITGCNNFCSYCVVPYARGREKSRPVQEILNEVKSLIKQKFKAITLLGQNVNSYQGKINENNSKSINFPTLLQMINNIPGDFWIWFITSHPKDMSDELIKTIASCKKVCPYIHLPVQAGSNEILKKMNRGYTRQHYLNLIRKIRNKIPNAAISTDIIVGFPGETKKQFQETCQLFQEVKFDMAYIAQYSEREGTAAAKLIDNVPYQEKKRRKKVLTEILKKTALENNKKLIGKTIKVLVEKFDQSKSLNFGKTKTFKTVKFKTRKSYKDQIVQVRITDACAWGLMARINPNLTLPDNI